MKRRTFILSTLALLPLIIFAKAKKNIFMRIEKGLHGLFGREFGCIFLQSINKEI
jgi:hypothetical protein